MKLLNPDFKFSGGGATARTLTNFLDLMEKEFGVVTAERIVDFCICAAYAFRNTKNWTIKQIFGKSSINRLKDRKHGTEYYEDNWLSEVSLTRSDLIAMVDDRSKHPLAKYIYVASEEISKKRLLNSDVGYIRCQSSTLGWSPLSDSCCQCRFAETCKKETQRKFPELYRIRIENGNKTK